MKIKRKYIAPAIDSYTIDQDISMVMMTTPPDHGENPGFMSAPTNINSTPDYSGGTLKSSTPFGGTTPNYDNH